MQELHRVELISVLMPVRCQETKAGAHPGTWRISAFHTCSSMRISNRGTIVKTDR